MPEISFNCPECQKEIKCDSSYAGMEAECPFCFKKLIIQNTKSSFVKHKKRSVYILLGVLGGYFGLHNFYSGHCFLGALKLAIKGLPGLVYFIIQSIKSYPKIDQTYEEIVRLHKFHNTSVYVVMALLVFWSLIEVAITTKDQNGIPFK